MRIAVEGCAHGELEIIYETLSVVEKKDGKKIDLLICCGDFQATRNIMDLKCMAVPEKYKDMCSFYKYYSGEKVAPVLTIFIGGNHEASNYLQELPYGGWAAPNIYYMGYAGVVTVAGLKIAGISGIYKSNDWTQGHYEQPPYTHATIRSVYHTRNLEVFRLKQLRGHIDIFLSHDWPRGITKYGNETKLLKKKPYFARDIEANTLGSPACMELLQHHFPLYWFSAHLHCKFAAIVKKEDSPEKSTKFLALDKCLPKRKFLQILNIGCESDAPIKLSYDLEWLTILFLTNHLMSVKSGRHYMPGEGGNSKWQFTPTESEMEKVLNKFDDNLLIPENFEKTATAHDPESMDDVLNLPRLTLNPQTMNFCDRLGIDDPTTLLQVLSSGSDSGPGFENNDFLDFTEWIATSHHIEPECMVSSTLSYRTSPEFSRFATPHSKMLQRRAQRRLLAANSQERAVELDENEILKELAGENSSLEEGEEEVGEEQSNAEELAEIEEQEKGEEPYEIEEEYANQEAREAEARKRNEEKREAEERNINEEKQETEEREINEGKLETEEQEKAEEKIVPPIDPEELQDQFEANLAEPDCKKFKRRNQALYSDNV